MYSGILKSQQTKKDTTNNKKQKHWQIHSNLSPQQLKNSEPGRRLRLSTYRGRLARPDGPPRKIPRSQRWRFSGRTWGVGSPWCFG